LYTVHNNKDSVKLRAIV